MGDLFNRPLQTDRRRELRSNATKPEQTLWRHLRNNQLEHKFRRQQGVGPYILDFYCPSLKLCIEIDGDSHETPEGKIYDQARTEFLNQANIKTLRFTNTEVTENIQGVLETIRVNCL
ncbi:MAG: endonuclease domain-containing protein [Patescibacteria group bacterium]